MVQAMRAISARVLTAVTFASIGLLFAGTSIAGEFVAAATADTYTAPSSPDRNYGNLTLIRLDNSKIGFLDFDLSALDGAAVTSAVLNLHVNLLLVPGTVATYKVLGAWNETTVTSNNKPAIGASPIASASIAASATGTYLQLDVTSVLQEWIDAPATAFGIALRPSGGLFAEFGTREAGLGAFITVSTGGSSENLAPTITSTPPTSALISTPYTYAVEATDPNVSDTLTYSLDPAPPAMSIDAGSGLIEWTPLSGDEGVHAVTVRVVDDGVPTQSQTQSFNVLVGTGGDGPHYLYFSTLGSTAVPGVPSPFDDADVYRFDFTTGTYDRAFDASRVGLPSSADIDALHVVDPVTFYMSFALDTGTNVPGLGLVMDEDVVLYHAGKFSWYLRGADIGLGDNGNAEDIDGIHLLSGNSLLLSTTGTPTVSGVSGARSQDVLRCDGTFGVAASCSWSMYLDGSTVGLSTADENINALFDFDGDMYFSTRGPFSVSGLSGGKYDVSRCQNLQGAVPVKCASFTKFFDGMQFGISDDIDGAHYVPDALIDPDPSKFRVVILGSSTATGTGASSPDKSWVGLLEAWLDSATTSHEVINLALGGQTTEPFRPDGVSPTPDANRNITRALELHPDLIILNFPSNNVNVGIPVATTMAHYHEMQSAATARGVPLLLTTTQPRNFGSSSKRMLLQDEAIAVRSEFGAAVIDIYDELTNFGNGLRLKTEYDSGDGTHLNDAGHDYLFRTTRTLVEAYVSP